MIVRSAGHNPQAFLLQCFTENLTVFDNLPSIIVKLRLQRFTKAHRLSCDDMHQRSALDPWENITVKVLCEFLFAENDAAARSAERFMCS